jgi:REP element-mobilizing transposase RayT
MPNHVHLVLEPLVSLAKISKSIKSFTARAANEILGRTGERFWHDDSYERWLRNDGERTRIAEYTESNPVSAGLIVAAEEWPWSSAGHALIAQ